ncbi:hypothetical protein [Nocardioides endophyticus]|uniref:hypothetical protein n=1 Tax=Nocardioides endophyticus TaxID=1353775 RepID=UPI0031EE1E5E
MLLVLVVPYGYMERDLTPFQLGLLFAVAVLGALLGAVTSTAVGLRLGGGEAGRGGAIVCSHSVNALGVETFRQARTPDELQAHTNTTLRSLNRAVIVVVSPGAGLLTDRVGLRPVLAAAVAIFCASALTLAIQPHLDVTVAPPAVPAGWCQWGCRVCWACRVSQS